ncbi:MAG: Ni/Fe hydrogenase subunit alpha [bacterium]|nr:Ni/Fe hydrogenase subunit alpha [bacterium]
MKSRTVKVDYLARVEGEGGLLVKIKDNKISEVKLNIFEPPRFFEAFLRGRHFDEVPDITARICGICPVAYQMSSCNAIESAFGVHVDGALRNLRRLLYCGEWIESHVLHVFMLHAPDFLGYQDAIQIAKDHPELVKNALRLKKLGNEIMRVVGGREIHPINVRVGGFYRTPTKEALSALLPELEWAKEMAVEMIRFTAGLSFPDFDHDYEFVSLRHPDEYPVHEGRIVSSKGLDITAAEYNRHFVEEHVPHANALHSLKDGKTPYLCGPLARFNLNFDKLSPLCQKEAESAGVKPPCANQFKSIVVRSIETLFAVEEATKIISGYAPPDKPSVEVVPRSSSGAGCSEAPRGILYHHYKLSDQGMVMDARIVPPTSQNQRMMEYDLRSFVEKNLSLDKEELTLRCEQAVRNYDPCISCATHFLKLQIEQE